MLEVFCKKAERMITLMLNCVIIVLALLNDFRVYDILHSFYIDEKMFQLLGIH